MAIIVQKWGGTSVATVDKIKNIAAIAKLKHQANNKLVIIVSAMAGVTDQLMDLTKQISNMCNSLECDKIISTGEQVTAGLLACAITELNIEAVSYLGWQIPILTDDNYNNARIKNIDTAKIFKDLNSGKIVIIAGFQGVDENNNITTLGRGGSDTTAVAIAVAIGSSKCEIYTDVEGIYNCDPKIVPTAKKIKNISYEQMLEMASLGSKVLQTRSVIIAMKNNLDLIILSNKADADMDGTNIYSENLLLESPKICAISSIKNQAFFSAADLNSKNILKEILKLDINIDMINYADKLSFSFNLDELIQINEILDLYSVDDSCEITQNLSKISLTGIGLKDSNEKILDILDLTDVENIKIYHMVNSETRISILIDQNFEKELIVKLYRIFNL